jgi:1,4-dihydroxy-2-naphthoate octaprenyltransferase
MSRGSGNPGSNSGASAISWVLAARPKTLVAAVVPVWVGTVLAGQFTHTINLRLAIFALGSATALQIATNLFNDALDHRRGADTAQRLGPRRMTASGAVSERAMLSGAVTMLLGACVLALPLIVARGWPILAIGLPSLVLTFAYTGGPWPLAYHGLGEVFVLIFFGWVAVAGSVFVNSGGWLWPQSLLAGTQVGLFACVMIAINNFRDIAEDKTSGKRTLAAQWGKRLARIETALAALTPYALSVFWWPQWPAGAWVPLLGLPLGLLIARRVFVTEPSPACNRLLALSAVQLLTFAALFTIAALAC